MSLSNVRFWLLFCVAIPALVFCLAGVSAASTCQQSNAAYNAMPLVHVEWLRSDGSKNQITAKLANNSEARAAGFQYICKSVIAVYPMLFVFDREVKPSFHMHNVSSAIDIVFIRKNGSVDSFYAMQVYSLLARNNPLYSPKDKIIAALEAAPGFFTENEIDHATRFSWQLLGDT